MEIIEVINVIKIAIMIIDFIFEPNQMIMMGPNDTLGKLLKMVKKGSNILDNLLDNQRKDAIIILNIVVNINDNKTS